MTLIDSGVVFAAARGDGIVSRASARAPVSLRAPARALTPARRGPERWCVDIVGTGCE